MRFAKEVGRGCREQEDRDIGFPLERGKRRECQYSVEWWEHVDKVSVRP